MTQPTTTEDALRLATILARVQVLAEAVNVGPRVPVITFTTEVGPKFIRIVQHYGTSRSVHAFVDRSNGDLIKAAGWKAPAKGKNGWAVRGNLVDDVDFVRILTVATWHGGYLYADASGNTQRHVTVVDGVYTFVSALVEQASR